MAEHKRITLHPIKEDGTLDLDTNLYPKTNNVVDEEGNLIEVVSHDELENGLSTKQDKIIATSSDVGKLVGVDNNGNLTLVEAPSSGTKLYKHSIFVTSSGDVSISMITVFNNLQDQITTINQLQFGAFINGYVSGNKNGILVKGAWVIFIGNLITFIDDTDGTIKTANVTFISDTVTEL